jgi:hypothetical protein
MGFIMKGQASRVDKGNKRVKHLLFRVWGSGFRDLGLGVCDLWCICSEITDQGLEFGYRYVRLHIRISSFLLIIKDLNFRKF